METILGWLLLLAGVCLGIYSYSTASFGYGVLAVVCLLAGFELVRRNRRDDDTFDIIEAGLDAVDFD